MRKPRDFDAELHSLNERASRLKTKKAHQLGDLVIAAGADRIDIETLAGALIAAAKAASDVKEGWRREGQLFFQGKREPGSGAGGNVQRAATGSGGDAAV